MFLATYSYSKPDDTVDSKRLTVTVTRTINTDNLEYALRVLNDYHNKRGETVEGTPKLVKGLL